MHKFNKKSKNSTLNVLTKTRKLLCLALFTAPALFSETPGDGTALEGVHPSFQMSQARPSNFEPQVADMDFLSDGRLVLSTVVADAELPDLRPGTIYILSNINQDNPDAIQTKVFATGLNDALGIKVVNDKIYVLENNQLSLLVDNDGDGVSDEKIKIFDGWNFDNEFYEYAFGPVYKDGFFYIALSVSIIGGGNSYFDPNKELRGCMLKISEDGSSYEIFAGGLRTPNGLNLGPEEEIFATDNQGIWLPASKLIQVQEGHFYGHRNTPFDVQVESPPAVWLPWSIGIMRSPTKPLYLKGAEYGVYDGHFLIGENRFGTVQRTFLEKIKGVYQGAVFHFSGGFEAGVNTLAAGPNGSIYAGALGSGWNWSWQNRKFGLQKFEYTDNKAFEMLAVRSLIDGFEIEFTQPVGQSANDLTNYEVSQWWYEPTKSYGGLPMDEESLNVTSVESLPNSNKVTLILNGLKEGHVVHIRLKDILSQSGEQLWAKEAWYTLNSFGPATPVFVQNKGDESFKDFHKKISLRKNSQNEFHLFFDFMGPYTFSLLNLKGINVFGGLGDGPQEFRKMNHLSSGVYQLVINVNGQTLAQKVYVP